jgi:hypothetical protein
LDEFRLVYKGHLSEFFGRFGFKLDLNMGIQRVLKSQAICTEKKSTSGISFSWDVVAVIPDNSVPCAKQVTPDLMGPPSDRLSTDQTH